jgi:hypothetical protein
MRDQLSESLSGHFNQEIERSLQEIRDTIKPYTRFIRSENEKNTAAHKILNQFQTDIINLSEEIESAGK